MRYLSLCLQSRNGDWPNRSFYLTLGKLAVDVAKLLTYVAYFLILFANYGMPLIMVRCSIEVCFCPLVSPHHSCHPQIRDLIRAFVNVNTELANLVASRRLRNQVWECMGQQRRL